MDSVRIPAMFIPSCDLYRLQTIAHVLAEVISVIRLEYSKSGFRTGEVYIDALSLTETLATIEPDRAAQARGARSGDAFVAPIAARK